MSAIKKQGYTIDTMYMGEYFDDYSEATECIQECEFWECSECGERFDNQIEAEDCCAEEDNEDDEE